jgi:YidC/Oxa1 family membrane protein insertase
LVSGALSAATRGQKAASTRLNNLMIQLLRVLIYYPFINLLSFFIWLVPGHNAAWGIILLTLVVRFILLVPSRRAAQSQRKINQMQPLLEELKAEYGTDRQGLATAQMDLYKKNGINPFASCLPLLIQLPILIILYRTVLHGLDLNNPHLYAWLPRAPFINTSLFGINLLKPDHTYILPILAAALQFFQAKMILPPVKPEVAGQRPDPAQMVQRQSVYLFPLLTFTAAIKFPAGAALYWTISTLFTVIQQYYVNKEKLALTGLVEAEKKADKAHPENVVKAHKVKEVIEEASKAKNGVTVTVRRKKK